MRKSIFLACAAASFAVVGCDNAAEAPVDEDVAVEEPAVEEALTVSDGGPPEGTYEITGADGTVTTYVANPDGTFVQTGADGTVIESGTWRLDAPNRWCDTIEGEEERCYTESVDDAGVWTSTNEADPDQVSTIVRIS